MPISTTDVAINVTSSEIIKNSTCVVTCTRTGEFKTIDPIYETSLTHAELEALLTDRFDNIAYYNAVDGGIP